MSIWQQLQASKLFIQYNILGCNYPGKLLAEIRQQIQLTLKGVRRSRVSEYPNEWPFKADRQPLLLNHEVDPFMFYSVSPSRDRDLLLQTLQHLGGNSWKWQEDTSSPFL